MEVKIRVIMLRTTRVLPVCVAVLVTAILFIGAGEVFASESTIRVTQIAAADAPMPAASASAPVASTAPHSDSGNMSWVLTSTVLVLMMGFPGIALFYSGLSRSKNSVNAFMQILAAVSIGSIAFVFVGFGVAFLPGNHFFGSIASPSTWVTLNAPIGPMFPSVPAGLFGIFQVAFAAVTISIVLGASIERIRFPFVLLFVPLWVILVFARWHAGCGPIKAGCTDSERWTLRAAWSFTFAAVSRPWLSHSYWASARVSGIRPMNPAAPPWSPSVLRS
jgi:hypothetical protein